MGKPRSSSYSLGQPLTDFQPLPILANRAPQANDTNYILGQYWINVTNGNAYILTSIVGNSATWSLTNAGAGGIAEIDGDTGTVTPTAGVVNIVGGDGITTSGATDTLTISATGGFVFATGTDTLASGTVDVANTDIEAGDIVLVTRTDAAASSALGVFQVTVVASTGFTIDALALDASVETADESVVSYVVIRPV